MTRFQRSDLFQGKLHLEPKRQEWSNAHPNMLGHVGVDAPQFGQLNNTVQTAMVRQEFDRLTMDVLLARLLVVSTRSFSVGH